MPPQANDAIENMRARIVAEKALNAAVNNRFTDKAPHLKRQLKFAADTLDDLERMFLPSAEKGNQSMWLYGAEVLFQIAVSYRKAVEELVNKYGSDIMSIG